MTYTNMFAKMADIGRRLEKLDVRLAAELDRIGRGEGDCLGEAPQRTDAPSNFHNHNSDHRGEA